LDTKEAGVISIILITVTSELADNWKTLPDSDYKNECGGVDDCYYSLFKRVSSIIKGICYFIEQKTPILWKFLINYYLSANYYYHQK